MFTSFSDFTKIKALLVTLKITVGPKTSWLLCLTDKLELPASSRSGCEATHMVQFKGHFEIVTVQNSTVYVSTALT